MKRYIYVLASLVFIIVAAFLVNHSKMTNSKFLDGRVEKFSNLRDVYNNPIPQLKTDFLIINFWATWCPPCVEETPSIIRFVERHSNQFTFLAFSQDDSKKDIENFIKIFPAIKSKQIHIIHDDNQNVAQSYFVNKLPETFIYSIEQNKYFKISGSIDWDKPEILNEINTFFKVQIQN